MGKFAWKTYGVRKNGAADFALPGGLGSKKLGRRDASYCEDDVRAGRVLVGLGDWVRVCP